MKDFQTFFKNKRVTVVGLGLLGKRLGDIAFMAECGAEVAVTDLKTRKELAPSIAKLKKYRNITYILGEHRMKDFENKDFILKGQGVRLDSIYIEHAREQGIPIEMDESLFAKLAPAVKIIGVTGTRGKSTVSTLIYKILKEAKMPVYLGGNILGTAALPLLKIAQPGDIAVFELSSWQLQGFGDARISPHIAAFTNFMPDHLNYYNNDLKQYFQDKSYIYKFQKKGDLLVVGKNMKSKVSRARAKVVVSDINIVPLSWKINLLGKHNLENIASAVTVARFLKVSEEVIKKAVEKFEAVPGRLEFVKKVQGIKIYNDTNSTTPEATIAALNSFSSKIILIMGGTDKNLSLKYLINILPSKTKKVFLLPGSGSDRVEVPKANVEKVVNLGEAMKKAMQIAKPGDVILFSPAFTSFGTFKNEYDRGDKFMALVKKIK